MNPVSTMMIATNVPNKEELERHGTELCRIPQPFLYRNVNMEDYREKQVADLTGVPPQGRGQQCA